MRESCLVHVLIKLPRKKLVLPPFNITTLQVRASRVAIILTVRTGKVILDNNKNSGKGLLKNKKNVAASCVLKDGR